MLGQGAPGLLLPRADSGASGLDVYRHAYTARLASALRDNFEVLALALGDDAFQALAMAYLAAHPSTQPSIRWFGHRLADFMASEVAADTGLVPHPALVDLARMDWALRGAFDAADAPLMHTATLAAMPANDWPQLHLHLHPSVRQVPLQWAVEASWRLLREHQDAGGQGDEPALPAPQALPHALLVWRRGLDTFWRSLDDFEAELLGAAADGQNFAQLCERAATLCGDAEQAPPRVVGLLRQWLVDGLISQPNPPQ